MVTLALYLLAIALVPSGDPRPFTLAYRSIGASIGMFPFPTPRPMRRRAGGRSRGCRVPRGRYRGILTQNGQMAQNIRAGNGNCAVQQAIFGEAPREKFVAVADRERGGDPALSAGGHGAKLHTRQGKHGQRNLAHLRYGGCQQAPSALFSPKESDRAPFTCYILHPDYPGVGASALRSLYEVKANRRSLIGRTTRLGCIGCIGRFECRDEDHFARVDCSVIPSSGSALTNKRPARHEQCRTR